MVNESETRDYMHANYLKFIRDGVGGQLEEIDGHDVGNRVDDFLNEETPNKKMYVYVVDRSDTDNGKPILDEDGEPYNDVTVFVDKAQGLNYTVSKTNAPEFSSNPEERFAAQDAASSTLNGIVGKRWLQKELEREFDFGKVLARQSQDSDFESDDVTLLLQAMKRQFGIDVEETLAPELYREDECLQTHYELTKLPDFKGEAQALFSDYEKQNTSGSDVKFNGFLAEDNRLDEIYDDYLYAGDAIGVKGTMMHYEVVLGVNEAKAYSVYNQVLEDNGYEPTFPQESQFSAVAKEWLTKQIKTNFDLDSLLTRTTEWRAGEEETVDAQRLQDALKGQFGLHASSDLAEDMYAKHYHELGLVATLTKEPDFEAVAEGYVDDLREFLDKGNDADYKTFAETKWGRTSGIDDYLERDDQHETTVQEEQDYDFIQGQWHGASKEMAEWKFDIGTDKATVMAVYDDVRKDVALRKDTPRGELSDGRNPEPAGKESMTVSSSVPGVLKDESIPEDVQDRPSDSDNSKDEMNSRRRKLQRRRGMER